LQVERVVNHNIEAVEGTDGRPTQSVGVTGVVDSHELGDLQKDGLNLRASNDVTLRVRNASLVASDTGLHGGHTESESTVHEVLPSTVVLRNGGLNVTTDDVLLSRGQARTGDVGLDPRSNGVIEVLSHTAGQRSKNLGPDDRKSTRLNS